jgi:uncharacterized spore protein YtfJ
MANTTAPLVPRPLRVTAGLERVPAWEGPGHTVGVLVWRAVAAWRGARAGGAWVVAVPLAVVEGRDSRERHRLVPRLTPGLLLGLVGAGATLLLRQDTPEEPRGAERRAREDADMSQPPSPARSGIEERLTTALGDAFARLDAAARAESAVGTPKQVGDRTVIPLAEVYYGGGFGLGGGGSPDSATVGAGMGGGGGSSPDTGAAGGGMGGGGGFGGRVRPVAVIDVGPTGAHVRPVVDVTTIGLALVTVGLGLAAHAWRSRAQRP